jgi:hypothetical protein
MSNSDGRDSNNAGKDVFFLVSVPVMARFPRFKATDPKSWTVLFTTGYGRNYIENYSSLGSIMAEKNRRWTDERHNDFSGAHF